MYRLLLSPRSSSNGWKVAGGRNLFAKRPAGLTTTTTTATTNNNNNNNNNNNKENGDGAIRRFFSLLPQEEEYKSLEYPNAKEAPEITKTIASEIRGRDPIASQDVFVAETGIKLTPRLHHPRGGGGGGGGEDPIAPSADLVETIRNRPLSKGVSAITRTVPPNIPPNVPAHQLETPETIITQLDNGVRVVSTETYGQVSVVGAVSALGSQWERKPDQAHATQLLELLAFGTTRKRDGLAVAHALQDWGGTRFANAGREQSLHCIDVLRPNVDRAVGLLSECLLEPLFDPLEVEEGKQIIQHQTVDLPPELWLGEALQMAAYGRDQALGQPHFCPPGAALDHLTAAGIEGYWNTHFMENPRELVIAGAGVRHDTMVRLAEQNFGHLQHVDHPERKLSTAVYRGGQCNIPHSSTNPEDNEFIRVGLAWPACGWHGDDLVATCVLQTLLGGGNSFSAGGPGKGMYSRLYRHVLNGYRWAESAEATTAFYNDTGLWGLTGKCVPKQATNLIKVLAQEAIRLAVSPVTDEELDRARNMLKNNVLTQLESRLVLFEDMGRQVLTYGKREDMMTTCKRIESVTQEDLMRVARMSLQHPPSLAAVGEKLDHVPRQDEVAAWFRG